MKRICHVNMLCILTNDKHSPKIKSQLEFDHGLFTKLPRLIVTLNYSASSFKVKRGIVPPLSK